MPEGIEGPAPTQPSEKPSSCGAFDAHHPPARELIDQCVHCGFCLPACPTYKLWNEEMDSPRGRIYLMKLAADGKAEMNSQWVSHFDTCLGCMSCMTACPSGVDYSKLIEATRAQIERNYPRSAFEKLYRRMIFATFPRPDRLRLLRLPLLVYQRSGLQSIVRATGILKLLPKKLRAMEALMPKLKPSERIPETDRGARNETSSRRVVTWMRPAGIFSARQLRDRSRACGRRLRGRCASRSAMLRRIDGSCGRRKRRTGTSSQDDRRLRARQRRIHHHERGWLRLEREGIWPPPTRRSAIRCEGESLRSKMPRHHGVSGGTHSASQATSTEAARRVSRRMPPATRTRNSHPATGTARANSRD